MPVRLRRYFQAHPILVLINQHIKQILMQPYRLIRMKKRAIELGEHNITEHQAKMAQGGDYPHQPIGDNSTYALIFEFKWSNNEPEYEALLIRIWLASNMNVLDLKIFSDSMLMVNQTKEADVLNKLASLVFHHISKRFLVEVLSKRSIEGISLEVMQLSKEEDSSMTPYIIFLKKGIFPTDDKEAKKELVSKGVFHPMAKMHHRERNGYCHLRSTFRCLWRTRGIKGDHLENPMNKILMALHS
uniref:RNase H type-1 domain-containing protein n=1 Tax=Lactuca sativa TaxID=4236 RepID=A0A9R1V8Y9_LACSA|nr:hypothetical protein LSAT_V11C600338840 [Lactuca sativa]